MKLAKFACALSLWVSYGVVAAHAQDLVRLQSTLNTNGRLASVAFSPDGKLVAATSGRSTTVRLWDTSTGLLKTTLSGRGHDYLVGNEILGGIGGRSDVSFSPDGNALLVVAREAREVRLWKIQTGKQSLILANLQTMSEAAFSPDGKFLALAAGLQGLQVLDLSTGKLVQTPWEIKDVLGVWRVKFSQDGSTLLSWLEARNDKSGYYLLDFPTGRLKTAIWATKLNDLKGKMSQDGQIIVTFDKSNLVKLWDATSGQLKKTVGGIERQIDNLSISPDNRTLAIINGKVVQLYDSESGELRLKLDGLQEIPLLTLFSPDGRILITEDKKGIKLWDTMTGVLKQSLSEARSPLRFSSDRSLLLTAGKDKNASLWQILVK
jgi:WD40 repeat protein